MDKSIQFIASLVPSLLVLLRQVLTFIAAEQARSGKTTEEIFNDAGIQLEQNEINLLNDLVKYAPDPEATIEKDPDL